MSTESGPHILEDPVSERAHSAEIVNVLSAPASIVVVGASATPGAVSARPLEYLRRLGYAGRLHVVHPRESSVLGCPAVASVEELPAGIEAAMLTLPAAAVPGTLKALADKGVRVAVSVATGFENPDAPVRRETLDVLANSGIRLIGPNCTGIMSPGSSAFLSMSSFLQHHRPQPGKVAVVSQSGGVGNGLLMALFRRGRGISHLLTTGNELNVGSLELTAGLLARDDVEAVGLFLEGITDADWLGRVSELIAATGKPVIFHKTARTDAGRVAAGGHTGRVVGPADVASAILLDAGLHETRDLEQLGDVLVCASVIDRPRGGRVGMITMSGSTAVLAADQINVSTNLRLHQPGHDVRARIAPDLDPRVTFGNPIDVGINETLPIANTFVRVRAEEVYDVVLGAVTSLAHDPKTLVDVVTAPRRPGTPMVLTYLSQEDGFPPEEVSRLAWSGIAVVPTPERAVMALDMLTPPADLDVDLDGGAEPAADAHSTSGLLGIEEIAGAAAADRLALAPWAIVDDLDAARSAAEAFGYPVVVKVAGRTLFHRADEGGVVVGVTADGMPAAWDSIHRVARKHGDVVMVQRQAAPGFELMMSALYSPEFGAVTIVRPGGVLAELMEQQVVLAGLWSAEHRLDVLRRSTIGRILTGYRGGAVYDLRGVAEIAGALAETVTDGGYEFIELNPVIVGTEAVVAVDALGRRR